MERAGRSILMSFVLVKRSSRFSAFAFSLLILALCLIMPTLGEAAVEGIPCSAEPTNMPIEYGDLVTCSIDAVGDSDIFRFSGTSGETVVIRAGGQVPCIELIAPDNGRITACENAFNNQIDTTLDQTGTYSILVTGWFTTTPSYSLTLERVIPPTSSAQSILYGETVNDEINPFGDMDLFFFGGTAEDTIEISAGGQVPCIELIAPDNGRITACENAFNNQIDTTLDQTGTYSILVTGWFTTAPSYSLTLECLAGPCADMHTLTVDTVGSGSGTVTSSDGKINCGGDCAAMYNPGTVVTLTAEEDSGSNFAGWSGGGCSGTGTCEITMNANVTVTATFTKIITKVTLLSPNGNEIIPTGSTWPVCWEAPAAAVKFTLKYSKDNGRTWILIEDNLTGPCYDWVVPKQWGNKKKCLVKVIGYNTSGVKVGADISDAPFTIEVVKLRSPDGGKTFTCGVCNPITWTTHATKRDVAKVKLYYTKNGGASWDFIGKTSGDPESFDCWAPTCTKPKNCKVRLELIDKFGNILGKDVSDNYFTIQP